MEREPEKRKCKTELKDMFRENGQLKNRLNFSQQKLDEVHKKIEIMKRIDKARELHVQQYQEERNENLRKISDILYNLMKKTATCIEELFINW